MTADKVNIVSLGDSIATGTLTPFSSTYSYVYYLHNTLRKQGHQPQVYQLAHDGDATGELLWKLNYAGPFRQAVRKADFITLSIGGNDLLRASSIPGFASINPHMAERGVRNFIGNWPRIIDTLKSINPEAGIVALNIYNPYNQTRYLGGSDSCDRNLCERTDGFLQEINGAMEAYSHNSYRVADVYTGFKQFAKGRMHRVCCLYPNRLLRNPHPTPRGQRLIADLVHGQLPIPANGDRAMPPGTAGQQAWDGRENALDTPAAHRH